MSTATPYSIGYRPDVADDTLAMVPFPLRHLPVWQAFMGGVGDSLQRLEDLAFEVLDGFFLDAAVGAQLDYWGSVVGEPRGPLEDADYRRFIRARALVNRSDSTVERLLEIWRTVMDVDEDHAWEVEDFPAGFDLVAVRPSYMSDTLYRRVWRIMQDAKPAGVTLTLTEAIPAYHGPATSRYGSAPTAVLGRYIHAGGP